MNEEPSPLSSLKEQVHLLVWSGFFSADDLGLYLEDLAYDEEAEGLTEAIEAYARQEMEAKQAAEADWPPTTDCDRLDLVFGALDTKRILALHNAGYTNQDAQGDAWHLIGQTPDGTWDGFCYYHGQDVERSVQGMPLYIGFDAVEEDPGAKLSVGSTVAAELEAAGFQVDWGGDPEARIAVTNFDWKRRSDWACEGESPVEDPDEATDRIHGGILGTIRKLFGR